MQVSKSRLQKIGKRIRSHQRNADDLEAIIEYRNSRIPELISTLSHVSELLALEKEPFLISGRPKRLKSIIRKLERSSGTSLARMADIIGMRLIVEDIQAQDSIVERLARTQKLSREILDYRSRDMYRAVHMYIEGENGAIELQVRTLPQQLWAIESENFGERVKEGEYQPDQLEYLSELASCCNQVDGGRDVSPIESTLGQNRGAISGLLPMLTENFIAAISGIKRIRNYLVTYDKLTRQQLKIDRFRGIDQKAVTKEYKRLTALLDENRYDILLLNANSTGCLKVTHPNYFPLS